MSQSEEALVVTNPLLQNLTDQQARLVSIIWDVVSTSKDVAARDWPVWDYVARTLHNEFPELEDAAYVFNSLPRIGRDPYTDRTYGLVWRNETAAGALRPEHIVGLTIAGIDRVERDQGSRVSVARALVEVIASLADEESKLVPMPTHVVDAEVDLVSHTNWLEERIDKTFSFPLALTKAVLIREPPRIVIIGDRVQLSGYWLRPYRDITTVGNYLDQVLKRSVSAQRRQLSQSPLTLIQTIDYFSMVIVRGHVWTPSAPIVKAPDLQSAAALGREAQDEQDFVACLLAASNIIDRFEIPPIPQAAHVAPERRKGSLNKLAYWLCEFASDASSKARVEAAIADMRDVLTLRHLSAHSGDDTRKRAAAALERLGMTAPIVDYPDAWRLARSALANAFDVLRLEVQSQPSFG